MQDRFHDSAGVPWEGREFSSNTWADDDGSAPVVLAAALENRPLDKQAVFSALGESRLLVPLVAQLGESAEGAHGQRVDKSADLAIVAVSTPDGKTAIPVFSSVTQMQKWRAEARPVPVDSAKVALAAIAEGHERIVIDPAGQAVVLRRPALAALAQGSNWTPPHQNSRVRHLVGLAAITQSKVLSVDLFDSDPELNLEKPELLIQLGLEPGIRPEELKTLLEGFNNELQSQEFLQLVDSIAIRIVVA